MGHSRRNARARNNKRGQPGGEPLFSKFCAQIRSAEVSRFFTMAIIAGLAG